MPSEMQNLQMSDSTMSAKRNAESADVGQHYVRGGIHRFASARGKAISDCRRVRLLAAALSSQRGRTPDSSAGDKIRRLTDAAKEAGPAEQL